MLVVLLLVLLVLMLVLVVLLLVVLLLVLMLVLLLVVLLLVVLLLVALLLVLLALMAGLLLVARLGAGFVVPVAVVLCRRLQPDAGAIPQGVVVVDGFLVLVLVLVFGEGEDPAAVLGIRVVDGGVDGLEPGREIHSGVGLLVALAPTNVAEEPRIVPGGTSGARDGDARCDHDGEKSESPHGFSYCFWLTFEILGSQL